MDRGIATTKIQLDLDAALRLVRQDRWLLGCLRQGGLRVIADSNPERDRPFLRLRRLSHLGRRCLQEVRPQAVSAVIESRQDPGRPTDWELDWPALLYAPVGMPRRRPMGLLIVGSSSEHWYAPAEVDYVGAVAVALSPAVLWMLGPLARLRPEERETVRLLGAGLSQREIAGVLALQRSQAEALITSAIRKLSLRSPGQLAEAWPDLDPEPGRLDHADGRGSLEDVGEAPVDDA